MSDYTDAMAEANAAVLDAMGVDITYTPNCGTGAPFAVLCKPMKPVIDQSAAPGYFADIGVDPTVILNPQRKDLVTWPDGSVYIVGKVVTPPFGLTVLAIHKLLAPVPGGLVTA